MKMKTCAYLVLAAFMTVLFAGCGGGGGSTPAPAPAPVQFAISPSQANVLADDTDSALITATFISPVPDGTVVNFSIPVGAAKLAATSATTIGNKATVKVTSLNKQESLATISAASGGFTATTKVNFVANIAVNTSKIIVTADGSDFATITATLPATVADNTQIDFVTSGTASLSSSSAFTSNGKASVTVNSTSLGQVTVSASLPNSAITGSVAVNFTIQIPVAASKATILADGNDFATITATLPGSVPVGATINFAVSGDTAVLSSPTAQTTSGGSASVTVKSSTLGAAVVTATYLGSAGSANVTFIQPQFSVSASKGLALANNTDTITITTAFQAPVPADGSVVNFSTSGAASLSAASATTTGGIATVTVKSATAGRVTVRADLSGSSATASTDIKFIAQPTSMAVTIAMNPPITSLAALQFVLINDPGATYNNGSYKIINQAAEQITSEPVSSGNNLTLGVFSLTFFDTLATPIIQLSYNISSGLPGVQVSPTGIIAGTGMNATPVTPPLTPSNFLLAVKYNTDTF